MYALSNLDLLNDEGQVTGEIDTTWLADKLGIIFEEDCCTYAATSISRTGSYNHTWRTGVVQNTVVAAGSFFAYKYSGIINPLALRKIEENGIGLRRQEGFGRILFNPDFNQDKKVVHYTEHEKPDTPELNDTEKDTLQKVQDIVNRNRIEAEITHYVNESLYLGNLRTHNLGMTQMSKLHNFLSYLLEANMKKDAAMDLIQGFFNDMKKKSKFNDEPTYKNKSAEKAFAYNNVKLNGVSYALEDLLTNVNNGNGLEEWFPEFSKLKFWGDNTTSMSNMEMKLRFLEQLVHAYMRKAGNRK